MLRAICFSFWANAFRLMWFCPILSMSFIYPCLFLRQEGQGKSYRASTMPIVSLMLWPVPFCPSFWMCLSLSLWQLFCSHKTSICSLSVCSRCRSISSWFLLSWSHLKKWIATPWNPMPFCLLPLSKISMVLRRSNPWQVKISAIKKLIENLLTI